MFAKSIYLYFLMLLLIGLCGCSQADSSPKIASSSNLLSSEISSYYQINSSERIRYSYPTRPFDVDITLEGIGWKEGQLIAVMNARVLTQPNMYSHSSKMLSPTITYKGKTIKLGELEWEEGASLPYKESIFRYAVSSPEASQIPDGAALESFSVNGVPYKLPTIMPSKTTLSAKYNMLINVGKSSKIIDSGIVSYQIERMDVKKELQKVTMLVRATEEATETSRFLMRDDQGRIFTFDSSTQPKVYKKGDNHIEMLILQPIPSDTKHLTLIIFESELLQQNLYNILDEVEIPLF